MDVTSRPIHETITDMKASIYMQHNGMTNYVPVWVGSPGIGKTALIQKLAEELDMALYYVSGAKPVEFWSGLPITNTLTIEENSKAYCIWTEPEIIHIANQKARTNKNGCILFIDDVHIIDGQAQKVFFEFILERSLHGHDLDRNVAIVAAMNGSTEAGADGFYSAIVNRFNWIPVHMDFEYWYTNIGYCLHPYIAGFLKQNNTKYINEQESTDSPFGTFRTWTELGKAVDFCLESKIYGNVDVETLIYNIAVGYVSCDAAFNLKKSVAIQKKFDFESMVKNKNYSFNMKHMEEQILFSNIIRYLKTKADFESFKEYIKTLSDDDISSSKNMISFLLLDIKTMAMAYKNKIASKNFTPKDKEMHELYFKLNLDLLSDTRISQICSTIY